MTYYELGMTCSGKKQIDRPTFKSGIFLKNLTAYLYYLILKMVLPIVYGYILRSILAVIT